MPHFSVLLLLSASVSRKELKKFHFIFDINVIFKANEVLECPYIKRAASKKIPYFTANITCLKIEIFFKVRLKSLQYCLVISKNSDNKVKQTITGLDKP
jgi:hypothetical protein